MRVADNSLVFSATDLSNFLACPHLSHLDRRTAFGGPKPPKFEDPSVEVLRQRGLEHEQAYLKQLDAEVVDIPQGEAAASKTIDAMQAGAPIIYQAELHHGNWMGRPDFLRKVDRQSTFGPWSYEIIDAKLARAAKGGALLQLLVYADLLEHVQGVAPERVHLALGGPEAQTVPFRVAEYAAYFRSLRRRFLEHVSEAPSPFPHAADPVAHCAVCGWQYVCDGERREVDHLSLVAGIMKTQRSALARIGVDTVEKLAALDPTNSPALERVGRSALERIREQARIQVEGRREGINKYELLRPVVQGEGLAALPPPSPGDIFFDLEGDPYALTYGIEYLFGYNDVEGKYTSRWALDREAEKRVFEGFIDFVMVRWAEYPDFHIYHYAPYEPTAVKRLMGRHATREEEVDRLLRGKVFVDLYRVVRQALRASVESYSIKKMEPFFGFERAVDLRSASSALAHFEAWLELGDDEEDGETRRIELLEQIELYNKDDCLATLALRDWLEGLRVELADETGVEVPRPERADPEPTETQAETEAEVAALVESLTAGVPADRAERSPEQHARWLLAQLLGFHRRGMKATWWEYFRCLELSDDELIEDNATLGGLEYVGVVDTVKRSYIHRYRFPLQEHGLKPEGDVVDPATEGSPGTIMAINDAAGTIDLKRGMRSNVPHPRALVSKKIVGDTVLRESVRRIARSVLNSGLGDSAAFRAAADLLMAHPPRVHRSAGARLGGDGEPNYTAPLRLEGESNLDAARRLVGAIDRSILPIQGPPGSGKTYSGARMIVRGLQDGKRVGITATSHKVIANLVDEVCKAAGEASFKVRGIQVCEPGDACSSKQISVTKDYEKVRSDLDSGTAHLVAGTAWVWSREDMTGSVDLLFVDEAGQFSLANALAVAPAADSLVLLGDPKQLDQPQQGVHPPGAEVSALDHLLGGNATMPPDRGLFLEHTWRLHPSICRFTSEIFYAGRLESNANLRAQRINGIEPLDGFGLRFIPVEHTGNVNESPEEVEVIKDLIERLLAADPTWTNEKGVMCPLTPHDILVVAPYNAQVTLLSENLPASVRIGTVDKFQGQQAAIGIYSLATSSAEEAPRGMGFLFSPNRLNVATSRSRALAVVVANPALFEPECRTPEQMRLANAFCRFREMAA